MDQEIKSLLDVIPVSELNYSDWIRVGMILKNEGLPLSVWDEWSKKDDRYHVGECQKKWDTFCKEDEGTVKRGTLRYLAGRFSKIDSRPLAWEDEIFGRNYWQSSTEKLKPAQQLRLYLEAVFDPDDYVGYVVQAWKDADGKWKPTKGVTKKQKELVKDIEKYQDDLGFVIGDWNKNAGAWIRINPLDGKGYSDCNVAKFKFVLIESDSVSIEEQLKFLRNSGLPIKVIVFSGGKSVHALVQVDACNLSEYKVRARVVYNYCINNGFDIDSQNSNPSRLSRLPGVTRDGKTQSLLAVNIGAKSWDEWVSDNGNEIVLEQKTDNKIEPIDDKNNEIVLPDIEPLLRYAVDRPEPPIELIQGVLRLGHKMLISGPSKGGKSFLLIQLALAIASGGEWIGFKCLPGKVLYINLEIDRASMINRFADITHKMGLDFDVWKNIRIWNLRGFATPLDELVPELIDKIQNDHFDAIIVDPIYKVITGSENDASEMGYFCNQFDRICNASGASVIYVHHHSKGSQGGKKAMDRASGSGVFARDPDAILDLIELNMKKEIRDKFGDGVTAWRMEASLREFPTFEPVNFVFKYPIHLIDKEGVLTDATADGSNMANLEKSKKYSTPTERKFNLEMAFDECSKYGTVTVQTLADAMGKTARSVRDNLKEFKEIYAVKKGVVTKII